MDILIPIQQELAEKIKESPESYKFVMHKSTISMNIDDRPSGYSWTIKKTEMAPGVTYIKSYKLEQDEIKIKTIKL